MTKSRNEQADRALSEEVKTSLVDGYLPCAVAFQVARKLKTPRGEVGNTVNRLGIRVIDCQLGCFGFKKATHDDLEGIPIDKALAEEMEASLVDGYLPCVVAFQVGRKAKVAPKEVGDVATKLKIRIVGCQLGCFP